MPSYRFKAIDRQGITTMGTLVAKDLTELIETLKTQKLFLVEGIVTDKEEAAAKPEEKSAPPVTAGIAAVRAAQSAKLLPSMEKLSRRKGHIPEKLIATFTTELQIMVKSSLPLLEALDSLSSQQGDPAFKEVLLKITQHVREGNTLSFAFSRHPAVFDKIYTSLLEAGEASGTLPDMLKKIASYVNFQIDLKAKIRAAMMYPLIVIILATVVVVFIVLFVLPTFQGVFDSLGVELPLPTRVLLAISANGRKWWYAYILGGYGAYLKISDWFNSADNTEFIDRWKLRTPGVGKLARNLVLTRVLRTLSALVSAGVPILKCLQLTISISGNKVFSDLLKKVYDEVSKGNGLAASLGDNPFFPKTVANMIANAEKTGSLPQVLNEVADFYEREIDMAIKEMFAVMEPAFVVILGLMVGGIAVSILLPIFRMGGNID